VGHSSRRAEKTATTRAQARVVGNTVAERSG
jgi:hypothetical protein